MTVADQKVVEKLAQLIHRERCGQCVGAPINMAVQPADEKLADAILQSPDLRVTLAEPRYSAMEAYAICPGEFDCHRPPTKEAIVRDYNGWTVGRFHELKRAEQYADWLNSKEPKS